MGASDIRVGSTSPVVNDRSEGFFWPGSGSFLLALALLVSRKPLAKRPRPILPSMKRMSVLVFCMTVAMASASCSSDGDYKSTHSFFRAVERGTARKVARVHRGIGFAHFIL